MSGECEECGEHCLECYCLNRKISGAIESKIEKIYKKYKAHPKEMMHGLQVFINVLDGDEYARFLYDFKDELTRKPKEGEINEVAGYICRGCATRLGAVPPKDHICTWHTGVCDFCTETGSLCHTSDWNWPFKRHLQEGREI